MAQSNRGAHAIVTRKDTAAELQLNATTITPVSHSAIAKRRNQAQIPKNHPLDREKTLLNQLQKIVLGLRV